MKRFRVGGWNFPAIICSFSGVKPRALCRILLSSEEDTLKLSSGKDIGYSSRPLKLYKNFGRNASVHFRMNSCIHILVFPLSLLAYPAYVPRLWNKWSWNIKTSLQRFAVQAIPQTGQLQLYLSVDSLNVTLHTSVSCCNSCNLGKKGNSQLSFHQTFFFLYLVSIF